MSPRAQTLEMARARVGQTLRGRWTLVRLLGVGGMAAVYEAEHRNRGRVAVKMLHPDVSCHEHLRERFLREGYVANTVDHPGVVKVLDDDVGDDGSCYLVMELLRGETLGERLARRGGKLPPGEALIVLAQVLDALAAAHDKGVVHRDLKPSNLFVTSEGCVKLLDFGIARLREPDGPSITATGDLLGTPAFMSPEQARGRFEEVDAQSDVWAAGATLFALLTGEPVHLADTAPEVLVKAVCDPPRPLAEVDPTQHPVLCALVAQALAPEKNERFASAAAMRGAVVAAHLEICGHALDAAEALMVPESAAREPEAPPPTAPTVKAQPAAPGQTLTATVRGREQATSTPRRWPWLAAGAAAVAIVAVVATRDEPDAVGPAAASAPLASVLPAKPTATAAPAVDSAAAATPPSASARPAPRPIVRAAAPVVPSAAPTESADPYSRRR